ncbi:hypothetical protein WN51_13639 [Melipona quadrifasciata]|uniref:Uncharacterized protein n=1 Tax=Melipona quadrifasciata TaxID=166423 RepID=A0A0M9A2X1_9HYME|nr:hypothetical protein WN51_13639 [Melipona quadrifasciata]
MLVETPGERCESGNGRWDRGATRMNSVGFQTQQGLDQAHLTRFSHLPFRPPSAVVGAGSSQTPDFRASPSVYAFVDAEEERPERREGREHEEGGVERVGAERRGRIAGQTMESFHGKKQLLSAQLQREIIETTFLTTGEKSPRTNWKDFLNTRPQNTKLPTILKPITQRV